jgi:hypothetical protein
VGVIEDYPLPPEVLERHLLPYDEEMLAWFDEVFGPPAWATPLPELVGGLDDEGLRTFGRWVQMRLSHGPGGGHDYDERTTSGCWRPWSSSPRRPRPGAAARPRRARPVSRAAGTAAEGDRQGRPGDGRPPATR